MLAEIQTYTIIRIPPEGFKDEAPYCVALLSKGGEQVCGVSRNYTDSTPVAIGTTVELEEADGDNVPGFEFLEDSTGKG
ncbi:OB-fold domain-containing protein [Corynebacterium camporealensis]